MAVGVNVSMNDCPSRVHLGQAIDFNNDRLLKTEIKSTVSLTRKIYPVLINPLRMLTSCSIYDDIKSQKATCSTIQDLEFGRFVFYPCNSHLVLPNCLKSLFSLTHYTSFWKVLPVSVIKVTSVTESSNSLFCITKRKVMH